MSDDKSSWLKDALGFVVSGAGDVADAAVPAGSAAAGAASSVVEAQAGALRALDDGAAGLATAVAKSKAMNNEHSTADTIVKMDAHDRIRYARVLMDLPSDPIFSAETTYTFKAWVAPELEGMAEGMHPRLSIQNKSSAISPIQGFPNLAREFQGRGAERRWDPFLLHKFVEMLAAGRRLDLEPGERGGRHSLPGRAVDDRLFIGAGADARRHLGASCRYQVCRGGRDLHELRADRSLARMGCQ
jgi:hypothetical protein